jgi:hypothetical protein
METRSVPVLFSVVVWLNATCGTCHEAAPNGDAKVSCSYHPLRKIVFLPAIVRRRRSERHLHPLAEIGYSKTMYVKKQFLACDVLSLLSLAYY